MFVLPSLGRPHLVRRFIRAYIDTGATATVVVWIGTDDPRLEEYENLDYPDGVRLHVDRPMFVGEVMQAFYLRWPNEAMYGYLSDDAVPRSWQWDREIEKACGDWYFAYPNEMLPRADSDDSVSEAVKWFISKRWLSQPEDIVNCNFPMAGGELVRALGGFMVADLQHYETDVFWQRVAVALDVNRFLPDVVLEHRHKRLGKGDDDDTYRAYEADNSERGYRGWKADLLAHAEWWCERDNLVSLDNIRRKICEQTSAESPAEAIPSLESRLRQYRLDRAFAQARVMGVERYFDQYASLCLKVASWLVVEELDDGDSTLENPIPGAPQRFAANDTSLAIVALCDGQRTVADILFTLQEAYPGEPLAIARDVFVTVNRLAQMRMIVPPAEEERIQTQLLGLDPYYLMYRNMALKKLDSVRVVEQGGETMLQNDVPGAPRRLVVNQTALAIAALCDGRRTVAEIVRILQDAYPDQPLTIARDVYIAVHELIRRRMICRPEEEPRLQMELLGLEPYYFVYHDLVLEKVDTVNVVEHNGQLVLENSVFGSPERLSANDTSLAIWGLCDGQRTVAEIVRGLQEAYPDEPLTVARDVYIAVHHLHQRQLLAETRTDVVSAGHG